MPSETTYSSLRENLATVLDQVADRQGTVIVRRRGAPDVALIPAVAVVRYNGDGRADRFVTGRLSSPDHSDALLWSCRTADWK
jgi:prevent-host-death family protein